MYVYYSVIECYVSVGVCMQVIAYAMKERQMSLDEAIKFVKRKRGVIQPNAGFLRQLRTYEGILDARYTALLSRNVRRFLV
jgi:protein-tyrosine phosphatase